MKKMIKSNEKNAIFDLNDIYICMYVYLILIFAKYWNYEKLIDIVYLDVLRLLVKVLFTCTECVEKFNTEN